MIRLYLITPEDGDPAPAIRAALSALPRGAAGVQLRQRLNARDLLARARALREICAAHGAPLLVNDRLDVVLAAPADGVHLPVRGVPASEARALLGRERLIGVSAHEPSEVAAAARDGADFCVFGPVFDTPGKGPPRGLDALATACRAAALPVLALGGVSAVNASRCVEAGARGVASIRSVLGAADPAASAIALWQAVTG